ncbi:MAG: hypothetical protein GY822_11760 [Deltaproteobacteria bacterium]|nr:hypothetical protein [Deltaproteobacteria bacterium]
MKEFSDVLQAKRQVPISRVEAAALRSTWQEIGLVIEEPNSFSPPPVVHDETLEEARRFLKRGMGTFRRVLSEQRAH